MKVICLVVSILFSGIAFSQNNFQNQLKSLINDSASCFKSFRSGFEQAKGTDSIYNSSVILDRTTKNNLFVTPTACVYFSKIAESMKKRQVRRIVDEWKDKISSALGNVFSLTAVKKTDSNSAIYGWDFEYGNLSIVIGLYYPEPEFSPYFVDLFVIYKKHSVSQ
jgi:hypothetical protein